MTFLARRIF